MPVRLWNGNAFPMARPDRGAGFGVSLDDPFAERARALPRINHHPWMIVTAVINQQRSLAFGPFTGAAVIRAFDYNFTAATGIDVHVGLRVTPTNAKDGVEEARGTLIGGRLLTFGRQTGGGVLTPYDQGYEGVIGAAHNPRAGGEYRIGIPDSRFFLTITFVAGAAVSIAAGLLVVWDAIDPNDLTEWL